LRHNQLFVYAVRILFLDEWKKRGKNESQRSTDKFLTLSTRYVFVRISRIARHMLSLNWLRVP